jgi:hypothetical protein
MALGLYGPNTLKGVNGYGVTWSKSLSGNERGCQLWLSPPTSPSCCHMPDTDRSRIGETIKTVSEQAVERTHVGLFNGRCRSRPTREVLAYKAEEDKTRKTTACGKLEFRAINGGFSGRL